MPYIKQEDREKISLNLSNLIEELEDSKLMNVGQLNYIITKLCLAYLEINGTNYENLNALHGVLSCASMEFYLRQTTPYEIDKIKINGDI